MFSAFAGQLVEFLCLALLCSLACAGLVWLHSLPDAGHKRDLSVGAACFAMFTLSCLFYAWDIADGTHASGTVVHWSSSFTAIFALCYGATRMANIAITLRRSERAERILKNKIGDEAMYDEMLPLASEAIRMGLVEVRDNYAKRGIGGWQSISDTSQAPRPSLAPFSLARE